MKILFVSAYFPPYAPMSGTRMIKLTRYFHDLGHDVRVLTARNPDLPPVLAPAIPDSLIHYVPLVHRDTPLLAFLKRLRGKKPAAADEGAQEPGTGPAKSGDSQEAEPSGGFKAWLRDLYYSLVHVPDGYQPWIAPAMAEGRRLMAEWRPDVIYASLPLHSGFLVAAGLSAETGVPLVVEYRDLWVEHPYYDAPVWKRWREQGMERRTSKQVSAYVTVTQSWATLLEERRGKPTELVLNGFDPADFSGDGGVRFAPRDKLTLFYAGALYGDKRDPSPLFEALKRMGEEARDIRVLFRTPTEGELLPRIRAYGLEEIVESKGPVPQKEVLALEEGADVLLLLRWDHPSEEAVLAGKLFEYIGAGRPILSVGLETGEAADIIRDNGLGTVSKDPDVIAAQLRQWLQQHKAGGVPALAPEAQAQFSRDRQFDKLLPLIEKVLKTE